MSLFNKIKKTKLIKNRSLTKFKENSSYLVFALPGIIALLLFSYFPMVGLVLAFKDYNFLGGIFGSPWAQPIYRNFTFFFSNFDKALRATRNTVMLNILSFIMSTSVAVSIAVMLSQLKRKKFIKTTQSIMFFPYFISWIVFGSILMTMLDYNIGTLNKMIESLGGSAVDWYSNPSYWILIIVLCNVWNSAGYSSIIYYASLSGVDPSLYEAAKVDGASMWKQITKISLPMIRPTIVMLFLLAVGNMLRGNLAMIMGLTNLNPTLLPVTDIIDVYVYRSGIKSGEMTFSAAISLYQSIFGFLLVIGCNAIVRRIERESALF
jgi:putative aldouronate transport system permease protein